MHRIPGRSAAAPFVAVFRLQRIALLVKADPLPVLTEEGPATPRSDAGRSTCGVLDRDRRSHVQHGNLHEGPRLVLQGCNYRQCAMNTCQRVDDAARHDGLGVGEASKRCEAGELFHGRGKPWLIAQGSAETERRHPKVDGGWVEPMDALPIETESVHDSWREVLGDDIARFDQLSSLGLARLGCQIYENALLTEIGQMEQRTGLEKSSGLLAGQTPTCAERRGDGGSRS